MRMALRMLQGKFIDESMIERRGEVCYIFRE